MSFSSALHEEKRRAFKEQLPLILMDMSTHIRSHGYTQNSHNLGQSLLSYNWISNYETSFKRLISAIDEINSLISNYNEENDSTLSLLQTRVTECLEIKEKIQKLITKYGDIDSEEIQQTQKRYEQLLNQPLLRFSNDSM